MTSPELREAVALLDEAKPTSPDSKARRKWSRRRWALRAKLRDWDELPQRVARAGGHSRPVPARAVDRELIDTTPKRQRNRLAKAELWLVLATLAESYVPEYDIAEEIAGIYGLSSDDIARICHQIGEELENRAMRAGYEDAWVV